MITLNESGALKRGTHMMHTVFVRICGITP